MNKKIRKEIRCMDCAITIKGYRQNRKCCFSCKLKRKRFNGKKQYWKKLGYNLGVYQNE
jgi:hypothetical protein